MSFPVLAMLKAKKDATGALSGINGPFLGIDIGRTAYPYFVVRVLPAGKADYAFRDHVFDTVFAQLIIVDDDPDDLKTYSDLIETHFNPQPTSLTTSSGTLLCAMRMRPWQVREGVIDKNGVLNFISTAEFKFQHQP